MASEFVSVDFENMLNSKKETYKSFKVAEKSRIIMNHVSIKN